MKRAATRLGVETAADRQIRELKSELSSTQYTIIKLGIQLAQEYERNPLPADPDPESGEVVAFPGASVPQAEVQPEQPLEELFRGYHGISSHKDFGAWQRTVLSRVIDIAECRAMPGDLRTGSLSARAACPLCRDTPDGWGYRPDGYALPEGLERHLTGWGNMRKCPVMDALNSLAIDATRESIKETDRSEAVRYAARRRNETIYLIDPTLEPKLIDEGWHWVRPRNAEELLAAEKRLRTLGFQREVDGNVVAYRLRRSPYAVLADPRTSGKLSFHVYDERHKIQKWGSGASFYMPDSWRHDLAGKFEVRFKEAIAKIAPPKSRTK
jgi:hypothetical protein